VLEIVTAGAGAVAIGLGTYWGVSALHEKSQSSSHCSGNQCDAQGVSLRDEAVRNGNASTLAIVSGSVAVGAALVLWLFEPRARTRQDAQRF
jgi:hypothetical protein